MDMTKIHTDNDFSNAVVPAGELLVFTALDAGGKAVTRYKDSSGNFGTIAGNDSSGSSGSSGSGSAVYKCAFVDTTAKTWTGYKALLTDGVYTFEETLTTGLTYGTAYTPAAGNIYDAEATLEVKRVWEGMGKPLTFTALLDGSSVTFNYTSARDIYSSTDLGKTWSGYASGTKLDLAAGETVQFWNKNQACGYPDRFSLSGKVAASGNIQSLLDFSETCPYRGFHSIFDGQSALVAAPDMPAHTIDAEAYDSMYSGTSVESVDIGAVDIGENAVYGMFHGSAVKEITVHFTTWTNCYAFTRGINSAEGTFYKPAELPEEYGESAIPENWNVVNI